MQIKLIKPLLPLWGKQLLIKILRTFIFLFCVTVFSLTSENSFSQEKITIDKQKTVSVDEVLSIIQNQTEYNFLYPQDLFLNMPKVKLKKGVILMSKLLEQSFSNSDITIELSENYTIVIRKKAITASSPIIEEQQIKISGKVTDQSGQPLPGTSILEKGTFNGTQSDFDGNYSLELTASGQKTLVFTYIGFKTVEIAVEGQTTINVTMEEDLENLDEVVVVGYGTQKKASVVGAITQVKGEDLQRAAGGITNVEEALQGNLPGVTAIQGSGIPGQSDVQIFIRGQASWNGSGQPLILVDGVPRSITDIDFNDIENLSVLKDASATAVFGVEGANGVILVTTKRGQRGKAQLSLSVNTTFKTVSKLPEKLDSYDAVLEANLAVERELAHSTSVWDFYRPLAIADKYRNPANEAERLLFPNVNWSDEILKDFAQDTRVNLSVRGGGKTAKYFGSLAYQTVNDIFDGARYDNGKGYLGEFKYERFNYRSNIDFDITNTTQLSVNLAGYLGIRESPSNLNTVTNAIYQIAPNAYTPIYPDGLYGQLFLDSFDFSNSIVNLTSTGYNTFTNFQVNTDFILNQKLDFITKGLSFQGRFSLDNNMVSRQQLRDPGADDTENVIYRVFDSQGNEDFISPNGVNDFDFVVFPWTVGPSTVQDNTRYRKLLYDFSFNYDNTFAEKHNVTGLLLVRRQETARGNIFPVYREDWVSRVTYDYDNRYFLDISGAYNGSEKFGPGFRFELFPAVAAGWTVTNESFMSKIDWLNKLKFRGSYGLIGDDNGGGRFGYLTQWSAGGGAFLVPNAYNQRSPYIFHREDGVGNPILQWETAIKYNIAAEIGLFNNLITAEFDYFAENRDDIVIVGSDRAVPDWFGTAPPDFNGGQVEVRGFEIVLGANYTFGNGLNIFGDFNFTQAKDLTIFREDAELTPFYQQNAGYPIGQPRSAIPGAIITSWDDVYSSTPRVNNQSFTRPGYYDQLDFDGDGIYNGDFDNAPFGYPTRPQRNWATTVGAAYKGLRFSVQFYGTQNGTRNFISRTFDKQTDLVFRQDLGYWTKDNPNSTATAVPFDVSEAASDPRRNQYDASLTRLRNITISYDIPKQTCKKLGVSSMNVFANGNNLFLWTDLPDDREFNGNLTVDSRFRGDYPTLKRFNFGFNLSF